MIQNSTLLRGGGLAQVGGTLLVIRTTNGQFPHETSLDITSFLQRSEYLIIKVALYPNG